MVEFECRRCAGRRKIEDEKTCYVCLGKGKIVIDPQKVKDVYKAKKS